jgi:GNAT superfamily N-acetyltransferase
MDAAGQKSISVVEVRPDCAEALALLLELDAQLATYPYPPESCHAFNVEKLLREQVAFFVARYDGQPAGCGGVKLFGTEYGEVKRMFVRPAFRGLGLGKAMLAHLAEYVRARGAKVLRLETGVLQPEAIGLYERFGFGRRGPFGEYKVDSNSVYFEKTLG